MENLSFKKGDKLVIIFGGISVTILTCSKGKVAGHRTRQMNLLPIWMNCI